MVSLRALTAKTISKLSRGIVAPTLPQITKIKGSDSRADQRHGVSDYAILDFDYSAYGISASQKDSFFEFENLELMDFSKLDKQGVIESLTSIKETGGLPDRSRIVILNSELKGNDADIKSELKNLIDDHDIVENLEIRYRDCQLSRRPDSGNLINEEAELNSATHTDKDSSAHVFSISINSSKAPINTTKAKASTSQVNGTQIETSKAQVSQLKTNETQAQTTAHSIEASTAIINSNSVLETQTTVTGTNSQASTANQSATPIQPSSTNISATNPTKTEALARIQDRVNSSVQVATTGIHDATAAVSTAQVNTSNADLANIQAISSETIMGGTPVLDSQLALLTLLTQSSFAHALSALTAPSDSPTSSLETHTTQELISAPAIIISQANTSNREEQDSEAQIKEGKL